MKASSGNFIIHQKKGNMKTIIVTGASSGIGLAIAGLLHQSGYRVIGTSRNPEKHKEKIDYEMLTLDVTSDKSVEEFMQTALAKTGTIDAIINNAGMIVCGSAEETPLELAKQQMETNFWGVVRLTRAVLPVYRKQKHGKIITIGSLAGLIGVPFETYYSASKHALEGFFKSLRLELKSFHIDVSIVEPGFFRSNLYNTATFAPETIGNYDRVRTAALKVVEESSSTAPPPDVVAKTVLKIVRSKKPAFSYRAGSDAKTLPVLHFLSNRIFEFGAAKKFKVN